MERAAGFGIETGKRVANVDPQAVMSSLTANGWSTYGGRNPLGTQADRERERERERERRERERERDRKREVGQDLALQVLDLMHGCSTPSLDFVFR